MILYFSATGNSRYVAERIAVSLSDRAVSIEQHDGNISLADGEVLGFVTPTNWFEVAVLVKSFMQSMTISGKPSYSFVVATYGSTPGYVFSDARSLLKRKGIALDAGFSVKMPDNWTPMFDLSDSNKVAETNRKAETYIDNVIRLINARTHGNCMEKKQPYFLRVFTRPLLHWEQQTRFFHVEDSCIGCGLCARKCPVGAIEMHDKRPVWTKKRCTICLGCLHRCPKFAIQYGKKTKQHGQYQHPSITKKTDH